MKVRTAITIEVIVDVEDPSDADALDAAAFRAARDDMAERLRAITQWYRHGTWEIVDPAERAAYAEALYRKTFESKGAFERMDTPEYKAAYERSKRDSLELVAREREAGEDMDGHKIGGDE